MALRRLQKDLALGGAWRERHVGARLRWLVVMILMVAGPVLAEDPGHGDPASAHFGLGKKRLGLSVGYGLGFTTSAESAELRDVSLVEVIPRFGIGVADFGSGDAWYRGNLELLVDGTLVFNTNPRFGYAAGGGLTLRYNFLAGRRVVPFVDGSFGVVHLDFDLQGQSDGVNFSSGAGAGVHWFVAERWSLSPEIRWQHISNAGLRSPNQGVNTVLFLLGTSYFFD